jgi:hypothetical protein
MNLLLSLIFGPNELIYLYIINWWLFGHTTTIEKVIAKNLSRELNVIENIMKVEYAKNKEKTKMYLHHFYMTLRWCMINRFVFVLCVFVLYIFCLLLKKSSNITEIPLSCSCSCSCSSSDGFRFSANLTPKIFTRFAL